MDTVCQIIKAELVAKTDEDRSSLARTFGITEQSLGLLKQQGSDNSFLVRCKKELLIEAWKHFDDTSWDIYPEDLIKMFANTITLSTKATVETPKGDLLRLSPDVLRPSVIRRLFPRGRLFKKI